MFKTILVPTDGSSLSEKAINTAVEAAKQTGGKIIGISVAYPHTRNRPTPGSPIPDYSQAYEADMREHARQNVQKVADAAKAANIPCETLTPQSLDPCQEIIDAAQKYGCDVIFMASHGRKGLSKLFLGSETQRVLAYSTIPVLVFR